MTDAMLRLGHKVYGAAAWRDESELRVYVRKDYGAIEVFDPANNSEQFVEVLAWLLRNTDCYGLDDCCVKIADDSEDGYRWFSHNGTPAGIRAAVVEAAVRVASA